MLRLSYLTWTRKRLKEVNSGTRTTEERTRTTKEGVLMGAFLVTLSLKNDSDESGPRNETMTIKTLCL